MSKTHFRDVDTVAERRVAEEAKRGFTSSPDLTPDETILWQGRPKRGLAFQFMDIIVVPFSIVWSLNTLSILFSSQNLPLHRQASWFHISGFGIIVVYLTIGRFIVDALYRSRLSYMVTNKRVMIHGGLRGRVRIFGLSDVRPELIEHANGRGTIRLNVPAVDWTGWPNWNQQLMYACVGHPPHLFRIRDARRVYALLRPEPPKPN